NRVTVIRQQNVLVDVATLRGPNNGKLTLDLFGSEVEVDRVDQQRPRPEVLIWYGRVAHQPGGFAILTLVHDVLIGHIVTQAGIRMAFYEIRYLGHGVHSLVQLDQSRFSREERLDEGPVPSAGGAQPQGAG